MRTITAIVLLLTTLIAAAQTGTGLGYRGVNNAGHFPASGLMATWPEGGPELLWKYEIGAGYASPTIVGDRVYVVGGEMAYLYVFTLDGQLESRIPIGGAGWKRYSGSRSAPLISNGMAVVSTPDANIYGIDLAEREARWQVNAWTSFGAKKGSQGWGYPETPLLHANRVIFNACSRFDETPPIIALDIETGRPVWKADAGEGKKYSAADVSGALVNHNGRDLILYPTWRYLVCLDAQTGENLWEIRDVGEKTIAPVYSDGYVLWDPRGKAQMLKLSKDGSAYEVLWSRDPLGGRFSHAVILDGRVYAFGNPNAKPYRTDDEKPEGRPEKGHAFLCLDAKTGRLIDQLPAATPGHIITSDGMVYYLELITGAKKAPPNLRVTMVKPTDEGMTIAGRFMPPLSPADLSLRDIDYQAGVNPVIAEGRLFLRYGPLQVYELRAEQAEALRKRKRQITVHVARLGSESVETRRKAVGKLADMGWQARPATDALLAALRDEDDQVAQAAGQALGSIGPSAVPGLIRAMRDQAVWDRGIAARALVAATPEDDDLAGAVVSAAAGSRGVREDAKQVAARLGAPAVEPLIAVMGRADRYLRWWVIEVLHELGPAAAPAVPQLAQQVNTGDQWFRAHAAKVLGRIGPEARDAVPHLVKLLKHPYADARQQAATALGAIGQASQPVLDALREAAQDDEEKVSQAAAAALERLAR